MNRLLVNDIGGVCLPGAWMNRLRGDLTLNQRTIAIMIAYLCRLRIRRRVPLHNLGACKLRRSIIGAPTLSVSLWEVVQVLLQTRGTLLGSEQCRWLRTVLTDLYVRFSLWKRNITFSLNQAAYSLVGVRCENGTITEPGTSLEAELFTNPTVNTVDQLFLWFDNLFCLVK